MGKHEEELLTDYILSRTFGYDLVDDPYYRDGMRTSLGFAAYRMSLACRSLGFTLKELCKKH